ncbi:MAG: hypothetical protein OXR66_01540 [Candidatus Woesearchaeota archaeon]|nr:hypothetical protein [Candidatus Woesearchaeota archaeon]
MVDDVAGVLSLSMGDKRYTPIFRGLSSEEQSMVQSKLRELQQVSGSNPWVVERRRSGMYSAGRLTATSGAVVAQSVDELLDGITEYVEDVRDPRSR